MWRPRRSAQWIAAIGVAALTLVAAACGIGSGRGAPAPATVPPSPAPATVPAPTAPAGSRLAIGTSAGMEIWSPSTGVWTIGPTGRDVRVSDVAWSADGRYLSWQTTPSGGGRRGPELWYAALDSGLTDHWGPLPAGSGAGPVVVTDTGLLTFGSTITDYSGAARHGVVVAVPAVTDPVGSLVESWSKGWVVEPAGSPGGQSVLGVTTTGAPLAPGVVLTAGTPDWSFDLDAVDGGGRQLAAELGRHGAGCAAAGTTQLWTASLTTGAVHYSTPPAPPAGVSRRFWNLDVTGVPGVVYASGFDCTRHRARYRVVSTVLWRFDAGRWQRVGAHLVAAAQVGRGPLATLGGDIRLAGGVARVTGDGTVRVGGRVVATGGEVIAWAPVRPPAAASALVAPAAASSDGAPSPSAAG